jgi:hypothetical protein
MQATYLLNAMKKYILNTCLEMLHALLSIQDECSQDIILSNMMIIIGLCTYKGPCCSYILVLLGC